MLLPTGTQVVTRTPTPAHPAGSVGVIESAPLDPTHAYRVRFTDNSVASFKRDELVVLRQFQRESAGVTDFPTIDADFRQYIIFRCVVGSQAYGLAGPGSDFDRRGVYLPPADLHWSLAGVPEQLDEDATQETYWELQKFLVLALKANPNVLECLYSPLIEHATAIARELLDMRASFLSKIVYQTYNGYVLSQFKKLSGDLRNKGAVKWKHVMHLIRLLLAGVTVLRTGEVPVRVDEPHRAKLLAIRNGEMTWEEVDRWRLVLHDEFDAAFQATALPDRPDYARVNDFLIRARRSAV
ncbi:MAG TPA: nucleotidyltransferase domain-containing protein [Tepidisphaeraceae bacterium]|nr:nucleotidyltransferase domain-containing protein [Tepidisphaeraceae bacterium]